MEICWKCPHPQAIQDLDEFILFGNRFGEIAITCSPMDPLQWMGAIRIKVLSADKNIKIIHK